MQQLPAAFNALTDYRQFVLWKLTNGKKLPINPSTLEPASSTDSTHWSDATTCITTASLCGDEYGVGFVFTQDDPFYFCDLDKCLIDGDWSPVAKTIMSMLPGAAIEISQSGAGLHIIGSGVVGEHSCKNIPLGLELYHTERFVALTGNSAMGDAGTDNSASLPTLIQQYFPPKTLVSDATWTTKPSDEWSGLTDDEKLITRALASKSAGSTFGPRASFADLWLRNVPALSDAYAPDGSDAGGFDESSADAALAQHLAFWTGKNCERIQRLMNQSALKRDKWQREDYMHNTITRAVSLQTDVHKTKREEPPRVSVDSTGGGIITDQPTFTEGYQFLGISQQLEHFKGCVYVQDQHRIFTSDGALLKTEQFNATYGGYVFQLEADSNGKTTRKAWEAFTESQGVRYPKATTTCFRPALPQGQLIQEEGRVLVNTYIPIETECIEGDITPFMNHLKLLLPDERDRKILLSFMAAIIQHKGVKFQWAPLLQGTEGNGKTLFSRCVAFAIGRRYTHYPKSSDLENKFNAWVENRIFIAIEDIFVAHHKQDMWESLKPLITNTELEVQGKGQDQITKEICCNIMMNCNGKDNLRKTANDRRVCTLFSAQQSVDDLVRDGMTGEYFPNLYKWLKNGGYAHVSHYLGVYAIPEELNPAGACHRAPHTTSTDEAVIAGMGVIEQEIMEAVEEGRQGFANGWISSMALERLIDDMRMNRLLPRNRRKAVLQSLGYDWHPALPNGRVTNVIILEGGKPRLFIKKNHIHMNLTTIPEVIKAYTDAQTGAVSSTNSASEAFNHGH